MGPYKARQDVTQKMLLEVLEAQSHNPTTVKRGGGRRRERFSICPTAKERKIDWKCCQCSERVSKGHYIQTVQITSDNCK
jgi:hypothetical protein